MNPEQAKVTCLFCLREKPGKMLRFSLDNKIVVFCDDCWTKAIEPFPLALRPQDYRAVINYLLALPDDHQAIQNYFRSIRESKSNAEFIEKYKGRIRP